MPKLRILGVQRGIVGLAKDTFLGRRPKERPKRLPRPSYPVHGRGRDQYRIGPAAVDDVAQRRDYDVRQRLNPTHSPIDPPPSEDLEPRKVQSLAAWLRERQP